MDGALVHDFVETACMLATCEVVADIIPTPARPPRPFVVTGPTP
jgi:hypothetical protein